MMLSILKSPWIRLSSLSSGGKFFANHSARLFMAGISVWAAASYCFFQVDTSKIQTLQQIFQLIHKFFKSIKFWSTCFWDLTITMLPENSVKPSTSAFANVNWDIKRWNEDYIYFNLIYIAQTYCYSKSKRVSCPKYSITESIGMQ